MIKWYISRSLDLQAYPAYKPAHLALNNYTLT